MKLVRVGGQGRGTQLVLLLVWMHPLPENYGEHLLLHPQGLTLGYLPESLGYVFFF